MLGLSSAARTVFHNSTFYSKGFLPPKDSPADSLIHSPPNATYENKAKLSLQGFSLPLLISTYFCLNLPEHGSGNLSESFMSKGALVSRESKAHY